MVDLGKGNGICIVMWGLRCGSIVYDKVLNFMEVSIGFFLNILFLWWIWIF